MRAEFNGQRLQPDARCWAEQNAYKWGFVTDIESDTLPPGLNEDVIRTISARKEEPEWLLEWRLKAYRHWLTMEEPDWAHFPDHDWRPIDYNAISYWSAPKSDDDRPKSLDEVDPKLLETYEKLGIPLEERAALAGVAVDATALGGDHLQGQAVGGQGHLYSISKREHRTGQAVSIGRTCRRRSAPPSTRRCSHAAVRVHSQGVLPHGAEHLLSINSLNTGQFERTRSSPRRDPRSATRGLHRCGTRTSCTPWSN